MGEKKELEVKGSYSDAELEALAEKFLSDRDADLGQLLKLPIAAQAYLGRSSKFKQWLDALFFAAALPGSPVKIGQSQARAARWFTGKTLELANGKRGNGDGEAVTVEAENE